jgi:hypothetical protein
MVGHEVNLHSENIILYVMNMGSPCEHTLYYFLMSSSNCSYTLCTGTDTLRL